MGNIKRFFDSRTGAIICNRYLLFIGVLHLYLLLWRKAGGIPIYSNTFRMEVPILVLLYMAFNKIIKHGKYQPVIAAIPIFVLYTLHDTFYMVFDRIFRLSNFHELPALFEVAKKTDIVWLTSIFVVPLVFFLWQIDWRGRMRNILIVCGALLLLGADIRFYPQSFIAAFDALNDRVIIWSDMEQAAHNGRFMSMLYKRAHYQEDLENLDKYLDGSYLKQRDDLANFIARHSNHHNVHMAVLESFLDPTLFENLQLSTDAWNPKFRQIFGTDGGNLAVASIFGGGTAQSEFESLCGVPAYGRLSSIEFNRLDGKPVECLPGILNASGYRTAGTHPSKPHMYNRVRAYTSLGFKEIYFPKEYYSGKTFLSVSMESPLENSLFDGDLYKQLFNFWQGEKRPIFNYTMTMYGHYPGDIDLAIRPAVITIKGSSNQHLLWAINQFYYRTGALADYINNLVKRDPKSIIVMVSDHLPPLEGGVNTYKQLGYLGNREDAEHMNRLFIIRDGKPMTVPLIHYYDIPAIIYDYLTDGAYCKNYKCAHLGNPQDPAVLQDNYLHLMAAAL